MSYALLLTAVLALAPQEKREQAIEDFKAERERILIECGQRHLDYGLDLRKRGLTLQAATQISLAVEASKGRNEGALMVLGLLRNLEEGFWKRKLSKPSSSQLESYVKKARKLRTEDVRDRLDIVRAAERRGLDEQALEELEEVLLALDEPLVFDEKGALEVGLGGSKVSRALSEKVRGEAIEIDGRLYVRDACLRRVPEIERIFECTTPELRVRSTRSREEAQKVHAAAAALLPILYDDLGVLPEARPQILLLGERRLFVAYLDRAGLSAHRGTEGFADRLTGSAVLCPETATGEAMDELGLIGLALHELTHLCQLAASPAALPPWYLEGSAESHGGPGTFVWDGKTLTTGGLLAKERLDELRAAPLTFEQLFQADPVGLLSSDRAAARRFYAQAWAFLRFLETHADPSVPERLARWRGISMGSILGADFERAYVRDPSVSQALFLRLFGEDLPRLEEEFRPWLAAL